MWKASVLSYHMLQAMKDFAKNSLLQPRAKVTAKDEKLVGFVHATICKKYSGPGEPQT